MLQLRLDTKSGVPPYLQLVQQVTHALRVGMLDVGDQLPTVKEVAAALAINPNTVLKAYRELEHTGVVEGRPGVGTFVTRLPVGPPPDAHLTLARSLGRWVDKARAVGLGDQAIEALVRSALQCTGRHRGGRRMSHELAIETRGLTKQYRSKAALVDCTINVPTGRISALVGPNGAGKTTLLQILTGLRTASCGEAFVLGRAPEQDPAFLADVGFLAQEIPMYKRFSAEDHIEIGAHLNLRWDSDEARRHLQALDIPLDQAVGTLSGGQRAQVALALALAKRPSVLLLDEPVAALDPLARRHFLASLAAAVADGGLTVLLSSHLVTDLERVCDHVVLLASAQAQLCGDIDDILGEHRILTGPHRDTTALERDHVVVENKSTDRQTTLVVRTRGPIVDPNWDIHTIGLEDLILAYMGNTPNSAERRLHAIGAEQ